MLSERKNLILGAILKEHVETAKAVGSGVLVEKYGLGLSPASIRNAMAELEEDGYLSKPHTSAGRVPTVQAYQYYLKNFSHEPVLPKRSQDVMRRAADRAPDGNERVKFVAKSVADLSDATVVATFGRGGVYTTGLANLFHQPEFEAHELVMNVSRIVDNLDDILFALAQRLDEPQVLLGDESPFGRNVSALLARVEGDGGTQLFGIVGPMRMQYDANLALLDFACRLLEEPA